MAIHRFGGRNACPKVALRTLEPLLPRHAPLLTILDVGELTIIKDGATTPFAVSGGFMEVLPNRVTILADTAERADEIDEARAEEARRRAEEFDWPRYHAALQDTIGTLFATHHGRSHHMTPQGGGTHDEHDAGGFLQQPRSLPSGAAARSG